MTVLGFALLLIGAMLVVAEAHVSGGILGVMGGLTLIAGGVVVIAALGGGVALAAPVGAGLGLAGSGLALVATRKVASSRSARIQAGAEALCGRIGVVRRWGESAGQVFIDGALWRAQHRWMELDGETLHEGDRIVVEHVSGLTLSVRRAEEWESIT